MSGRGGRLRTALVRMARDAREIVAPTSLPDNPTAATAARRARPSAWRRVVGGTQDYVKSWRRPPAEGGGTEADGEGAGVSPSWEGRDTVAGGARAAASSAAQTAGRAAEALRPALQHLYRTRAAAYRDAVFSFAEGYRDGLAGGASGGAPGAGRQAGEVAGRQADEGAGRHTGAASPDGEKPGRPAGQEGGRAE